jgi:hypothetical protein
MHLKLVVYTLYAFKLKMMGLQMCEDIINFLSSKQQYARPGTGNGGYLFIIKV